MSTPATRTLSRRAGGSLASVVATSSIPSQYGRTPAYRRIAQSTRTYSHNPTSSLLPFQRQLPPFRQVLRSDFLPKSIAAVSQQQTRSVSFKELREERARQKAGESPQPSQSQQKAASQQKQQGKAQAKPEAKPKEKSASDEAEEAFAKAKAASEREWKRAADEQAKQEKQEEEGSKEGEDGKEKKKEDTAPPPHGDKTPWQVFTETLKTEFKSNKDWNEGTKQLGGAVHDFTQNPNVQRAKTAYSSAASAATTASGKVIMGTAGAIGKSAAWTWDTSVVRGVRKGAGVVGAGMERATRPVRQTEAYKNVKNVIDDGSTSARYGGWTDKEERRKRREEEEAKKMLDPSYRPSQNLEEDPNAGTNVTLHKDAAWKESWRDFRDNSPMMQRLFGLKSTYQESENPLISTARSVSDRIAGFFAENETAQVIKKFREMDPSFQLEPFLNEMRQYILPEVLEAYVKGDVEVLKLWLSAAQFQVYSALMKQYTTAGLKSDGKILDIRGVDILSARMLDPGDIPVFVIMCRTQEVHVYRNKKTNQLAAGMEDKVQQVTYAIGVTRIPEDVANPETRGWKFIELQKSGRDYI
ncbi:Tim44-domain-containing protein [Polychaeton citri CBS 116435]|uniref:Mitochondrial import inner membrane translocase subunit TIM44 n=1 Tax=Polychaeton citri CBS 116435 TaxID=1314669 RepID=A0A9P4QDH6_9PEZI|nr:Tim44-domain-containing protein [Polychaeton citri CBS 116435]